MKWEDHLNKINTKYPSEDDLEKEAFENWKEQFLSYFDDDERPQKEKEVEDRVSDLDDVWIHYESSSGAWRDEDEFRENYMPISSSYGGYDFSVEEEKQFDLDREKDKWLNETSEEHPDMFRRAEFNKNHNSLYFYDKDGNKHRVSTHLANTNNGENVYDWMVDDYNDIPSKAEEIIDGKANLDNGKFGSLRSVEHSRLKSGGSNLYETPKTIIPYDQLKNYKNQEDTFEADEDRQEEDSNNLSKKEITKYE